MEHPDSLVDFEVEKRTHIYFLIAAAASLLLLIASGAYQFWLFRDSLSDPLADGELVGLLLILVVFPAVGLILFIMRRKAGWYITELFSIMNVTYIINYILEERTVEVLDLFFAVHLMLLFLLLTKPVMETFSIARKTATNFAIITSVVFIGFFYFLF